VTTEGRYEGVDLHLHRPGGELFPLSRVEQIEAAAVRTRSGYLGGFLYCQELFPWSHLR